MVLEPFVVFVRNLELCTVLVHATCNLAAFQCSA